MRHNDDEVGPQRVPGIRRMTRLPGLRRTGEPAALGMADGGRVRVHRGAGLHLAGRHHAAPFGHDVDLTARRPPSARQHPPATPYEPACRGVLTGSAEGVTGIPVVAVHGLIVAPHVRRGFNAVRRNARVDVPLSLNRGAASARLHP